jgi:alkylation response protein AidB-like acyl-CoA dehydrogenase
MEWKGLKEEHKLLRQDMKRFAKTELEPEVSDMDKGSKPFTELLKKLGEIGGLGMIIPEEFGGVDMDLLSLVVTIEELSKVSPSFALSVAAHNLMGDAIVEGGSEDIKKKYLPSLTGGNVVGGLSMDTMIHSEKEKSEDERFVVNGSFSDIFGFMIEKDNIREFLVKEGNVKKEEEMMGMKSSGIGSFKIKEDELDGVKKFAFDEPEKFDAKVRLIFGSIAAGISQATLEYAITYSKQREQFGRAICKFGMVRDMLAEMALKTNASKLLVYQASCDEDITEREIAAAFAMESALFVTDKGVQIYGGYGYTKDYPLEMLFRDAKVIELFAGSVDYRKVQIGKILTS